MASKNIELSLTESFAKHKRNLLLVCAIVAVVAVASPDSVKMPLGMDASVPGPVAFFFLLLTLLYFFFSYGVELLAVRARNSAAAADTSLETVSDRLMNSIGPMELDVKATVDNCRRIDSVLKQYVDSFPQSKIDAISDNFHRRLSDIEVELQKDWPHQGSPAMDPVNAALMKIREFDSFLIHEVKAMTSHANNVTSSLDDIKEIHREIEVKLNDIDISTNSLVKKFDIISDRISASQRFGFGALEQGIPIGLFLCALILCVDGAFFQSTFTDCLRASVPAIEQMQAEQAAMPKQGPTSTETR